MKKILKVFGSRFQAILLSVLLLLVTFNYGALAYLREALAERDYSVIPDPQLRVGYCMLSNTAVADKYMLAETSAHPPDFGIYSAVMSLSKQARDRKEVRTALGALKDRDSLRERAHRLANAAAAACGYWGIKWPSGSSPLAVILRWIEFDTTFSGFVERIRSEPDAAERLAVEFKKQAKNGAK